MAITIDLGEAFDVHPRNKQDVGDRLALVALAQVYDRKDLVFSGPIFSRYQIEGSSIRVHFHHVAAGLIAKGERPTGFAVAGKDRKFVWADARIDGGTVLVSAKSIEKPVAVRYAWADNPVCNLYNSAGLPASPFRTDDWEATTRS
jgi:sialate O-acetylesterase